MLPWQVSSIDHIQEARLPHLMGEMISYMANVAHIEAFVTVTRGIIRALKPRGAIVELDPHKGEAGK